MLVKAENKVHEQDGIVVTTVSSRQQLAAQKLPPHPLPHTRTHKRERRNLETRSRNTRTPEGLPSH